MKISIETKTFLQAMGRIAPCVPNNPNVPILSNALFEVRDGLLNMTATDFEKTASTFVKVQGDGEVRFCVDQRKFQNIVKNAISPRFEVEVMDKVIMINLEKSTYELPLGEIEAYPNVEFKKLDEALEVDGPAFFEALMEAKRFTNNDDLRQFFNVHITNYENSLQVQASDNYTCYLNNLTGCGKAEFSLLVPNRNIVLFEVIDFDEASLKMGYSGNTLLVNDDLTQVAILLTDAKFPPVNKVIPAQDTLTSKFTCDKDFLISAINRLSVVYGGLKEKKVRFDFTNDMAIISSDDSTLNTHGKEYVPGTHEGDVFPIGFNANYLLRSIQCIDSETIEINMKSEKFGAVLKDENREVLVMPTLLNN
ncbi:DNA polymerase III subunit beta [Flagellimonas nanhaiensis]|uniref:Beta sliding clamp n=1 Tax=Flagellimonas nanhaiensis TaxID=2292706 RepID=A0A371JN20_9FLAO|nr:DNA polymerase III subunit beta [Allomuricauda nanhaiensis]RDY58477.1 DNA polymerase III subunit beta [Allomuricauda nanhaiensis]